MYKAAKQKNKKDDVCISILNEDHKTQELLLMSPQQSQLQLTSPLALQLYPQVSAPVLSPSTSNQENDTTEAPAIQPRQPFQPNSDENHR